MEIKNTTSNKKFGYFFGVVFLGVFVYTVIHGLKLLGAVSLLVGVITLGLAFYKPSTLGRLNNSWFRLGLILSAIISPFLIGLIYYILITPLALTLRWFGRDELRLKLKKTETYWIERESGKMTIEFFQKQY
jgi:hypothetical protein